MRQALEQLAAALARRAETAPDHTRKERAQQLLHHVKDYLIPRAADATAPLVVVVLGSTGVGKSSLFNAIAGRAVSESGLLRPTTRRPVALVHPADAALVSLPAVDLRVDPSLERGLVIVDAPDFDSVERSNRQQAIDLLEAADLVIFVTTVTRYADQVPWDILARTNQRGLPLLAVINRIPHDPAEAETVMADYRAMIERGELDRQGAFGELEVVAVPEGALDRTIDGIQAEAVAPILDAVERLRRGEDERRSLARRSLANALAGLPAAVEKIAAETERDQEVVVRLRRALEENFVRARRDLARELDQGTFLRREVLAQWLDFVNAGPVARFLSEGVGRVAASLRSLLRPAPPAPPVREAAFTDLVTSVVRHADSAASATATAWMEEAPGAAALADRAELWGASPELSGRLHHQLGEWVEEIGDQIRELGAARKGRAQAASLGLNALATSAILAVFVHTGGLTGAEIGIGAATAVLNQKLLEAIFGEGNVSGFVSRARSRLDLILDQELAAEQERFTEALGERADPDLARQLRAAVQAVGEEPMS